MKIRFFFLLLGMYNATFALTKVDITRGHVEPLPIAISDFLGDKHIASELRSIIINDLEGTGLFRVIAREAYIDEVNIDKTPTFASWRQINATTLIGGSVSSKERNVGFKVWDVFAQAEISHEKISLTNNNIRKVAHKVADEIYKKLTGEDGYFNSQISYVSLLKDDKGRYKRRIAVMDYDGHNHQFLTAMNNKIVLTPRFSPDAKNVLYLSYENKLHPKVREINVNTKLSHEVGEFNGMSYAPRYVDDRHALLAVAKNGASNIHILDLATMKQEQITFCSAICTSPSASPDKTKIVFNSDMGGTRQLYVMDYDGKHQERITFNHGYYSSPVWSPRGDLIAFTKMLPGKGFFIGVMRPDGSGERVVARGWLVDGATWAPNGRVLMFERENGPDKGVGIYTVDITGHNERRIKTPYEASDPYWSRNFDPE